MEKKEEKTLWHTHKQGTFSSPVLHHRFLVFVSLQGFAALAASALGKAWALRTCSNAASGQLLTSC